MKRMVGVGRVRFVGKELVQKDENRNRFEVGVGVVWEEEGCCCSVLDFETH